MAGRSDVSQSEEPVSDSDMEEESDRGSVSSSQSFFTDFKDPVIEQNELHIFHPMGKVLKCPVCATNYTSMCNALAKTNRGNYHKFRSHINRSHKDEGINITKTRHYCLGPDCKGEEITSKHILKHACLQILKVDREVYKPFICSICGNAWEKREYLMKHLIKHKREEAKKRKTTDESEGKSKKTTSKPATSSSHVSLWNPAVANGEELDCEAMECDDDELGDHSPEDEIDCVDMEEGDGSGDRDFTQVLPKWIARLKVIIFKRVSEGIWNNFEKLYAEIIATIQKKYGIDPKWKTFVYYEPCNPYETTHIRQKYSRNPRRAFNEIQGVVREVCKIDIDEVQQHFSAKFMREVNFVDESYFNEIKPTSSDEDQTEEGVEGELYSEEQAHIWVEFAEAMECGSDVEEEEDEDSIPMQENDNDHGSTPEEDSGVGKPQRELDASTQVEKESVKLYPKFMNLVDVKNRLRKVRNTAPGPDKIQYRHWKEIDPSGELLMWIFNICIQHKKIPKSWKGSRTFLFLKPKGKTSELKDWRPISLLCTIYKLFLGILADRISSWCKKFNIIHPSQKGGSEHNAVLEHTFLINEIIQNSH